ncbi:hypothetical protein PCIT_b0933 [Pseudoalteromonas citrea]|uniref:Glycosyl transferase family 1 domain-containing protein n=2 Tax=Pseudoalteromonas citrea TaxID=43655 RepID=A0AAD4AF61_9GAMM|nr:glycosyltransferase [Pseudoalteromonas citrea]KAF7764847.1 hypothetical protein PCIT_b0933 [Pseudoalteromonas citrea]
MLILYVESGAGSRALALTMQQRLQQRGEPSTLVSLSEILPVWLTKLLFDQYYDWCLEGKQHHSKLYGSRWFYPVLYKLLPLMLWFRGNDKKTKAKALFTQHQQVLACSYYGAFFARYYCQKLAIKRPIHGVLGDYSISSGWQTPVDNLFVSHAYDNVVFEWHKTRNTPVHASGIPAHILDDKQIRCTQLGRVLLCGGGWGLGITPTTVHTLLSAQKITRLQVICGQNESLKQQLTAMFNEDIASGRLEVLGFVDDLTHLYQEAEVLITKSGGITLTEASLTNTCVVVSSALPGQEQHNRAVFKKAKAVVTANSPESLLAAVVRLIGNTEEKTLLTNNAAALVRHDAPDYICNVLLNHHQENRHVD